MRILVLVVALLGGTSAGAKEIEISNFKSGLACTRSTQVDGGSGWICQPTELILVTDQGHCVFDKQDRLCTWVGFEFDYVATKKGSKLQCSSTSSKPSLNGNPDASAATLSSVDEFEIELPDRQGHFYNPQYFVMNLQSATDEDLTMDTKCLSGDEVAFEFRFRVHFPLIAPPVGGAN